MRSGPSSAVSKRVGSIQASCVEDSSKLWEQGVAVVGRGFRGFAERGSGLVAAEGARGGRKGLRSGRQVVPKPGLRNVVDRHIDPLVAERERNDIRGSFGVGPEGEGVGDRRPGREGGSNAGFAAAQGLTIVLAYPHRDDMSPSKADEPSVFVAGAGPCLSAPVFSSAKAAPSRPSLDNCPHHVGGLPGRSRG